MAAGVAGQVHGLDGRAAEVEDVAVGEARRRRGGACSGTPRRRRWRTAWSSGSPYTSISPSRLRTPGRSSWWTWTRASGNSPLPAMWSSWLWLLTTASTAPGAPPRATTVTDGSMMTVSAAPAHEQRVAGRVGAVGVADEHAHRRGQPTFVVTPVDGHHVDGTGRSPRHLVDVSTRATDGARRSGALCLVRAVEDGSDNGGKPS